MLWFVALCSVVVLAAAETTEVSQCINNGGELPINTYVRGCITPPCVLPQLENGVIDIVFRAPRTMTSMRTLAEATVIFLIPITLPYDLGSNAITCDFLNNTYCPVIRDEVVSYTMYMFIEPFFPVNIAVTVELTIQDEHNVNFLCIRIPIRIGPPRLATRANETSGH